MANAYVSLRNLQFQLFELLEAHTLQEYEFFRDYDRESMQMAMEAALQLADQYLYPYYREMDQKKAHYQDGEVWVHPAVKDAIRAMAEAGWIGAIDSYEAGGQQMPLTLLNAAVIIFNAANPNIAPYAFLTQGAANLIRNFGSEELEQTYILQMYAGKWQGTMVLTEPQAGSSLSDLSTTATPTGNGAYKLRGQKIYISSGDHTAAENVVHLALARIEGAPPGTKGISLFVVPKHRPDNGQLVPNDVTTAGIYGKMGQKGYVAAHLMLGERDDCHGYLVGEPHKGLRYMFQMMNEARIGTGVMAAATASAAYYASLKYANKRPQGRHPSKKDATQPPVLIIEHADVRRMLLFQKAVVEGSIALLMRCSHYADVAGHEPDAEKKKRAHLLLELLTPVAKSWPSEMGIFSVSTGMQVLGGAGYTDDFPLEQYFRDIRVNSIYEGTTTIHGMDLLGRKVMMENGKAAQYFAEELQACIQQAAAMDPLKSFAEKLAGAAQDLQQTTMHLMGLAMQEKPEVFLADATLFLEYFGTIAIAWQWLEQALVAQRALNEGAEGDEALFYQSKLQTCRYFFEYELPKTCGLQQRLRSSERVTLETRPEELV
jgi:butyryl-CoA dehydrogenase